MEQINCYAFLSLGIALQNCYNSTLHPLKVWEKSAQIAKQSLGGMLRGDAKFKLDESASAATQVTIVLKEVIEAHTANPEAILSPEQVARLNSTLWTFDQAISLEFGRSPIFYVTPKGAYDTRRLINDASSMYEGYLDRLPPEAVDDTNQAGRCLAFDLSTAAGFHIARATEAVIKQYMEAYNCPPVKQSQRNWGVYTKALTAAGANPTIIHHIDQIRHLHRNPLTHPDVTLTRPAAISLQAMCQSVIQGMVADLEARRPDPDAAIVAMLPPEPEAHE